MKDNVELFFLEHEKKIHTKYTKKKPLEDNVELFFLERYSETRLWATPFII